MDTVLDYLRWRGDLTLSQDAFCETDGIVLARAAYLPLERLFAGDAAAPGTLGELAAALSALPDAIAKEEDAVFLSALAESARFGGLPVSRFTARRDADSQSQFSAMTLTLPDGRRFLAFRGTDSTLVGWKEDFNMSFTFPVPSQSQALAYLLEAGGGEGLLLGGHSKGGNLAVYAAAYAPPGLQDSIEAVYNFDGPGFDARVLSTPGYRRIADRVSTYVPKSSIVGMLLEHEERYTVVDSTQHGGILQHNLYTWGIRRNRFLTLDAITDSGKTIDRALKDWMAAMTPGQREKMIDTLYTLFEKTGAETLQDLLKHKWDTLREILSSLTGLTPEERESITYGLGLLLRSGKAAALERLNNALPARTGKPLLPRKNKT